MTQTSHFLGKRVASFAEKMMPLSKSELDKRTYRKHHKSRLRKAAKYRRGNKTKIRSWWKTNRKVVYERWNSKPFNRLKALFHKAAMRAKARGMAYDFRVLDRLEKCPPTHCGCCNHKLDYSCGRGTGRNADRSPSFDRRNNRAGYTLANTFVVCYRCNRIKSDATWQELKLILRYARTKP